MTDTVVEGRSYFAVAPTEDLARPVARRKAQAVGQSNWATASVLWVERVGVVRGIPVYEVVLEAPTPTARPAQTRHGHPADRAQTP